MWIKKDSAERICSRQRVSKILSLRAENLKYLSKKIIIFKKLKITLLNKSEAKLYDWCTKRSVVVFALSWIRIWVKKIFITYSYFCHFINGGGLTITPIDYNTKILRVKKFLLSFSVFPLLLSKVLSSDKIVFLENFFFFL